jgi:soluble lytic murein transglycosylase
MQQRNGLKRLMSIVELPLVVSLLFTTISLAQNPARNGNNRNNSNRPNATANSNKERSAEVSTTGANTGSSRERERGLQQLRELVDRGQPSDNELIALEQQHRGKRAGSLARFLRAYLRYEAKDYATAATLFDEQMVRQGTEIGDYTLYYQGLAYREAGQLEAARTAWQRLTERYASSLLAIPAQLAAISSLLPDDPDRAIKLAQPLIAKNNSAALLLVAQAYEQTNRIAPALEVYRQLYYELPQTTESESAKKRLLALGETLLPTGKEGYQLQQLRARALYEARQFALAADAYKDLVSNYSNLARNEENTLNYGLSLYQASRYREAVMVLSSINSGKNLEQAQAYLASAYLRSKSPSQFAPLAERLLKSKSRKLEPRLGSEFCSGLIRYYETSDPARAQTYRQQLIQDYAGTKEADKASFQIAWSLHEARRFEESVPAFLEHLVNIPDSDMRGNAIYWAGRDAERQGNLARAAAIYEVALQRYRYGYYGYLAEKHWRDLQQRNVTPEQPKEGSLLARALATIQPATPLAETASAASEPFLARAANLAIIRLDDFALAELEAARRDAPRSNEINLAIARIHRDRGDNPKAVLALQRAHPDYLLYQGDEIPRELQEIFFPIVEWETIKQEAARHKIDPYVVAGLIRQESIFDPRARSRANALGLMQLLPSTGKLVAKKQGINFTTAEQLFNPRINIQLGTAYLAGLLDKYERIEYAAAGYNAGPGRVVRWLQTLPTDLEDWVEAIPFTETRLYVQAVVRNSRHYRRIYGSNR